MRLLAAIFLVASCQGAEKPMSFRLRGTVEPMARAAITIHGATRPFTASAISDPSGRFEIKKLPAGTYNVSVWIRRVGEIRKTVEIGPGTADRKRNVNLTVHQNEAKLTPAEKLHIVSALELSIPQKARKLYAEAEKRLGRRDVAGAEAKLEQALALEPRYPSALNYLGTIYYQTQRYEKSEQIFRKALEVDSGAYEPLVNLGGVLITLRRPTEALDYNVRAVAIHPTDALAQSQLGMNYFMLGQLDVAKKHLLEAQKLDPAHFSHPQLLLAQIYARMGNRESAADELESFLQWHPDSPRRDGVRQAIENLRK